MDEPTDEEVQEMFLQWLWEQKEKDEREEQMIVAYAERGGL